MGDQQPRFGNGRCRLPVLAVAARAAEPGECPLDHPPAGQHLETGCSVGPLDDLDTPVAVTLHGVAQHRPGIAAIGEGVSQPGP